MTYRTLLSDEAYNYHRRHGDSKDVSKSGVGCVKHTTVENVRDVWY